MDYNYKENEIQETIRLNGEAVCTVLACMKNNATEREISDYIINCTGQPKDLVVQEVSRILNHGLSGGFFVKNGNVYKLPSQTDIYHADCDEPHEGPGEDELGEEEEDEGPEAKAAGDEEEEGCIRFQLSN